jgi:hypothetical protein
MIFAGSIYAGIFVVIPSWLVLRAWRRYHALNSAKTNLFLVCTALALVTLALGVLLFVVAIAVVEERRGPFQLVQRFSLPEVGLINLLLCVGSLLISLFISRETPEFVSVRRSILGACIYLGIVWLWAIGAH